jgi:hypothetical protein
MDNTDCLKKAVALLKEGKIITDAETEELYWFQSTVNPDQIVFLQYHDSGDQEVERISWEKFEETYFAQDFKV